MVIYGVHRFAWGSVSEVELLTAHQIMAEDHAKAQSAQWQYGKIIVTSRELDRAGAVRVMSVWKNGERVNDYGPNGEWRRVHESPI